MRRWEPSTPGGGPSARSSPAPASTTRAARSTHSMRSGPTGSSAALSSPAGGFCAATRGATAASTSSPTEGCSTGEPAHPDRERPHARPRVAARHGRPALGVGDRGADAHGADPARAADRPPDPLDAADAGPSARDEGDPGQVQGRSRPHEPGVDGVLQGEQDQPGRVVPADRGADPDLLRTLLRPEELREGDLPQLPGQRPGVARDRAGHHSAGELALVGLPAARDLRDQPDRLDAADVEHDGPHAADAALDPAARVPLRRPQLSGRPRPLLGDHEPVDGGPGPDHASVGPEAQAAGEALVADPAETATT